MTIKMLNDKERSDRIKVFEEALSDEREETYVLRLYVSGTTSRSIRAIRNLNKICDEHLKGRCELEVVDIYRQPIIAISEDIMITPMLVKKLPLPLRKLIGDLSDTEHVLVGLDLVPRG